MYGRNLLHNRLFVTDDPTPFRYNMGKYRVHAIPHTLSLTIEWVRRFVIMYIFSNKNRRLIVQEITYGPHHERREVRWVSNFVTTLV